MRTTAKDLAAWAADQPGDMAIQSSATRRDGEFSCEHVVKASIDYLANRARIRLEEATVHWRDSIRGATEQRLAAWKALEKLRGEFEAEQGEETT